MSTRLSPHILLSETLVSRSHPALLARPDSLTPQEVANLALFAYVALEGVRAAWGVPLIADRPDLSKPVDGYGVLTSVHRSAELNTAIGGSRTSDHMKGTAADILPPYGMRSTEAARLIVGAGVPHDQVIAYHPHHGGHVHIGWRPSGTNRGQLRAKARDGSYPMDAGALARLDAEWPT